MKMVRNQRNNRTKKVKYEIFLGIKMIFMRYMHRQRGGRVDFTQEEMTSTLANQAPGSPNLSILSFKGCFHGRTIGLLSCSHSRPIQGVDIPTMPWPKADFPKYKYPLDDNARENKAEDDRCLALVEELMEKAVRNKYYFEMKQYIKSIVFLD